MMPLTNTNPEPANAALPKFHFTLNQDRSITPPPTAKPTTKPSNSNTTAQ